MPVDFERGERLTVPVLATVVLTATELEDDDLLLARLGYDLRRDLGARDQRGADLQRVAADEENLIEGDRVTDRCADLFDPEPVALRDLVLLAARRHHRIHG